MGRIVHILDDGKNYTYSEENLDSLKEAISGIIEQHKKQLFDVRLLGGIRGGEPFQGPDAHALRVRTDRVLINLRSRFIDAAVSLPEK